MPLNKFLKYFYTTFAEYNAERESFSDSKIVGGLALLVLVILLCFVVANIFTIYHTFFSIPHWDYWDWLKLFYQKGFWAAATAQYNEHRQFFPSFIFALDQIVDGGQNYLLISFLLLAQLGSFCLLLVPAIKFLPGPITLVTLGFLLLCGTWFQQGENLFWPISFHTLFCNLCVLLSLFCWSKLIDEFSRSAHLNKKLLASVLIFAILATFSFGHGITLWPFFIIVSLFKLNFRATFLIIVSFTAALLLYLLKYQSPQSHSHPLTSLTKPAMLLEYMSVYLSRLFLRAEPTLNSLSSEDLNHCYILGAIGLICAVCCAIYYLCRKANKTFEHFYIGVMFVGLCSAFITALGRLEFGSLQAVATRYITIQIIFWNGLFLMLLCYFFCRVKQITLISFTLIVAFYGVLIIKYLPHHQQTQHYYAQRTAIQEQTMRGVLIGVSDKERWKAHITPTYYQSKEVLQHLLRRKAIALPLYMPEIVGQSIDGFEISKLQCPSIIINGEFPLPNMKETLVITGETTHSFRGNRNVILVVDQNSKTIVGSGNTGAGYRLTRDTSDHSKEWVAYAHTKDPGKFEYYFISKSNHICKLKLIP